MLSVRRCVKKNTADFLHNVYQLRSTRAIPLSQNLFQAGLSLYETRLDKDWGLTDVGLGMPWR